MKSFMKQQSVRFLMAVMCVSAALLPALAHHSFVAEYDGSKSLTLTGTVKKLEWTNPHARFYIDVKDASGAMVSWELELGSPNTLIRYAWKRRSEGVV